MYFLFGISLLPLPICWQKGVIWLVSRRFKPPFCHFFPTFLSLFFSRTLPFCTHSLERCVHSTRNKAESREVAVWNIRLAHLRPCTSAVLHGQLSEGLDDDPIIIPSNDRLTALIGVLPLQLIAYELAVLKGINPDTPRNLAKVCCISSLTMFSFGVTSG